MASNESATPTPVGGSPTPTVPHATGTPTATEDEKGIAAVAYILTWITGLIILLVAKKEQRYARWNAIQAIGLGIAAFVLGIILNVLSMGFMFGGFGLAIMLGMLSMLLWIGVIILIILLAVKAYQGTPIRLPVLADFADKNA